VIGSLLVSAIMLGKNATSLVGVMRTIHRKRELDLIIGALKRLSGSIPPELMERVRRATLCEVKPREPELVHVLPAVAWVSHFRATLLRPRRFLAYRSPSPAVQVVSLRRMSSMSRLQINSEPVARRSHFASFHSAAPTESAAGVTIRATTSAVARSLKIQLEAPTRPDALPTICSPVGEGAEGQDESDDAHESEEQGPGADKVDKLEGPLGPMGVTEVDESDPLGS
jgi:hypothetical protein